MDKTEYSFIVKDMDKTKFCFFRWLQSTQSKSDLSLLKYKETDDFVYLKTASNMYYKIPNYQFVLDLKNMQKDDFIVSAYEYDNRIVKKATVTKKSINVDGTVYRIIICGKNIMLLNEKNLRENSMTTSIYVEEDAFNKNPTDIIYSKAYFTNDEVFNKDNYFATTYIGNIGYHSNIWYQYPNEDLE